MTEGNSIIKRIWWHKFEKNHPDLLQKIRWLLNAEGFDLILAYDGDTCKDAYIVKEKSRWPTK